MPHIAIADPCRSFELMLNICNQSARVGRARRRTSPAGPGNNTILATRDLRQCRAEHRCDGEPGDGDKKQAFDAIPPGKEAGRRCHDRGSDDIRGQHPVDLILARRDTALHIGPRDIGDGRVERLLEGGEDHADGDRPFGWCLLECAPPASRNLRTKGSNNAARKCGKPRS